MCVIIHKPAGIMLSKKVIRKCYQANKDGFGVAYREDDTVKYTKGLLSLSEILATLNPIMHLELAIHFRLATHGKTDTHNAHPFFLASTPRKTKGIDKTKSIALLMHNGVISHLGNKHYSDTVDLCTKILSKCKDVQHVIDTLDLLPDKFLLITRDEIIKVGRYTEHKACFFSNLNWDYSTKTYGSYAPKTTIYSTYADDYDEFYDDDEPLRDVNGNLIKIEDYYNDDETLQEVDTLEDRYATAEEIEKIDTAIQEDLIDMYLKNKDKE